MNLKLFPPMEKKLNESSKMEKEVSAGVLVVQTYHQEAKVLLIRTTRGIEIPKGHVEGNETIQEAALRELNEEAGVQGNVNFLLKQELFHKSEYLVQNRKMKKEKIQKEVYFFLGVPGEGFALTDAHEKSTLSALWFSKQDLLSLPAKEVPIVGDHREIASLALKLYEEEQVEKETDKGIDK